MTPPKPTTEPSDVPTLSERVELDSTELGFSLTADEQTLKEIDQIQEDAIKAAQANRKFAWR